MISAIPKLKAPIVLVHGLLGFGQIGLGNVTIAEYFPGIKAALESVGNRVLVPWLSPTSGVEARAAQLKTFLLATFPGEPVHLIAHSMGGLDARYMISRLGMANQVLSLTTIGTPHRGTSFADWGIQRLERMVKPMFDYFDLPHQAFYDLTRQQCRAFNLATPDAPSVRYFSVAGQFEGGLAAPEWLLSHTIVLMAEGPNDGIVSVESAKYGEATDVWQADHFCLTNWAHKRVLPGQFAELVQRLADCGF